MKFNKLCIMIVVLLAGFLIINTSVAAELDDSVVKGPSSHQDISVNNINNLNIKSDTGSDVNKLGNDERDFAYLNNRIQNTPEGGEVILDCDIIFVPANDFAFINGINLNRSITINGGGYQIFCFNSTRAFNVTADNVTIKNLTIFEGNSTEGGAIYWSGDNGAMIDVTLDLCIANHAASAIYWSGDNGAIIKCSFDNCWCTDENFTEGGAIYWSGDNGSISNSYFDFCMSNKGGAIYWSGDNGSLTNTFIQNSFSLNGGAIYWSGDNSYINNSLFMILNPTGEEFPISTNGGGIYWNNTNNVLVNNSLFIYLDVDNNGGAIYSNNVTNFNVLNSIFGMNSAVNFGGAIYCNNVNGSIKSSEFICSDSHKGKVLYLNASDVDYEDNFWGTPNTISAKEFKENDIISVNDVSVVPDNFVVLIAKLTKEGFIINAVNNGTKNLAPMPESIIFFVQFTDGSFSSNDPTLNLKLNKEFKFKDKTLYRVIDSIENSLAFPPFKYDITTKVYNGTAILIIKTPKDRTGNYVTGNFTVRVNNKVFTGILKNGFVSIPLTSLKPGSYNLEIFYSGDKQNLPFNTTFNITIPKIVPKPNPINKSRIPMEHTNNPLIALLLVLITLPIIKIRK